MKVVSFKSVGVQEAGDLEVNHPDHQFYLANGALTSNSHAVSYTDISMFQAWLKTYFAREFWASKLHHSETNIEKRESVWRVRLQMLEEGYKFAPVSVNTCGHKIKIDKKGRFHWRLDFINGVGKPAAMLIRACAPYTGVADLLVRTSEFYRKIRGDGSKNNISASKNCPVTKGTIVSLISAGAFDDIEANRLKIGLQYLQYYYKKKWEKISVYFDGSKKQDMKNLTKAEIKDIDWINGLSTSIGRMALQQEYLRFASKPYWKEFSEMSAKVKRGTVSSMLQKMSDGALAHVYGVVDDIKVKQSARGTLLVGTVSEYDGPINFVVYSDKLENKMNLAKKLKQGDFIWMMGQVGPDRYRGGKQLMVVDFGTVADLVGGRESGDV